MNITDKMIRAAARRLSDINARECGINAEDNWKQYAGIYIRDAEDILEAAKAASEHESA